MDRCGGSVCGRLPGLRRRLIARSFGKLSPILTPRPTLLCTGLADEKWLEVSTATARRAEIG